MLLFYDVADDDRCPTARQRGLQPDDGNDVCLYTSLGAAEDAGTGPILVVDATALDGPVSSGDGTVRVPSVPAAALQNIDPYRPPQSVTAAGGYVACSLPTDIAVLLIHRRGVWDLPKGHLDPDETLATCARREVQEEVGVNDVQTLRTLGTTEHGYPRGDHYVVKTTYWFLMRTPERSFEPDRREGIQRVAWARWPVARRHVGYDTLRRHMDRVETDIRTALS